jgi:hypothetical protein
MWNTTVVNTEAVRQEGLAELAKGSLADIETAMLGFCFCGSMDADYGCDFSSHLDNELLGVKELSGEELRILVGDLL